VSNPQVVIVRKDKRIRHKFLHAVAFALTGGMSGAVTAAEAAANASYNARTRQLQEQAGPPAPRRKKTRLTEEERAYFAAHAPRKER
jgi:hypothetical protein